ncbi:MAG: ATP-binding protein [Desulfurococcales archaeon]|nr:ATP-binding protein [Desulfurococcales archaeon]
MNIISITGGKGGTGKSFVATNLSYLLASNKKLLLADLDVEAPNDYILLGVDKLGPEEPIKIFFPMIDYSKCTLCGACAKVCDTGAIIMSKGKPPIVMPRLCSGCKACIYACAFDAIKPGERVIGYTYLNEVRVKDSWFKLLTGVLRYGEEHTAPAVRGAKNKAVSLATKENSLLIVDTGAGTGNSISIGIQYSNLVIAVTEPTPLGKHDLESILRITSGLGYRTWVVINRYGIADEKPVVEVSKDYGVEYIHKIPFHKDAVEAYTKGLPVPLYNPSSPVSKTLSELASMVDNVV